MARPDDTLAAAGPSYVEALDARIADIADACTRCGKCVEACPMIEPAGIDAGDPEAVAGSVIDLLTGGEGSEAANRWAEVCTGSGKCIPACDYGINPRFMMRMAKIAKKKKDDQREVRRQAHTVFNTMSRGVRMISRLQMPPDVLAKVSPQHREGAPENPDIVFYTGCNILKTPHIALLCCDVLDKIGVTYEVMGGTSHCCGVFQFVTGDAKTSGRVSYSTIDKLKAAGTSEVLSWCPSCQTQIGEIALPSYKMSHQVDDPFDLVPFISFMLRHLDKLKQHMTHRVERRVALHERPVLPQVVEACKEILKAIDSVELVELDVPRVGTMGNSMSVLPKYKEDLRNHEFEEAAKHGVDTLATIFHACHREICHFEKDVSFEIINFMEIVGEAMGIAHEDVYKRLKMMEDVDQIIADSGDLVDTHGLDLEDLRASLFLDMFATQPVGIQVADDAAE